MILFKPEKIRKTLLSFKYLFVLALFCSVFLPVLIILGQKPSGDPVIGGGFAVLTVTESYPDAEIIGRLEKSGIKNVISESTQWFFLNEFDSVEQVPLDQYKARLFDFDPRNDGYAEKLRAMFLDKGTRYLYIPLSGRLGGMSAAALEQRITDALEGMPYKDLRFKNAKHDNPVNYIIFITVSILCLSISTMIAKNRKYFLSYQTLAMLPSLAILTNYGAAGFALCSIVTIIFYMIGYRVLDFFIDLRRLKNISSFSFLSFIYSVHLVKKNTLIKFLITFVLICAIIILGKINFAYAVLSVFFAALSLLTSSIAFSAFGAADKHVRFMFIPIRSQEYKTNKAVSLSIIWGAAAFFSFAVSFFPFSAANTKNEIVSYDYTTGFTPANTLVSEADYLKHIEFQKGFTLRRLSTLPGKNGGGEYLEYKIDDSGLLSAGERWQDDSPQENNFTAFPLKNLITFLNSKETFLMPTTVSLNGIIPCFIPILLYLLIMMERRRGHRKNSVLRVYRKERNVA